LTGARRTASQSTAGLKAPFLTRWESRTVDWPQHAVAMSVKKSGTGKANSGAINDRNQTEN
jgi:hypothetical protein